MYPIAIKVNHAKPRLLARLATRFTKVTEQEVEEVYQWRLARWQETVNMSQKNDEQLLASVKFDPTTIRGQEGFFRVGKSVNGKWWFIDPEGKAFYHKGSTGLNAGKSGGRRANLPPVSQRTAKKWIGYLKEWGFNAMGAWTTPEFFDKNLPFTEIIETFYEKPWLKTKFPDVWDSQWSDNIDAKCKKLCQPLKNNKLKLKDNLNLDTQSQADGEYTLNLTRNDTKLEGTFQGLYKNYSVQGRVELTSTQLEWRDLILAPIAENAHEFSTSTVL